jgi:hypothetical protein
MAHDKNDAWKIPPLEHKGQDAWFRNMKIKLREKGVWYAVENTRIKWAEIAAIETITGDMEELDITDASGEEVKVVLNIDKNTKFLKDEAAALMYICQSLDKDDQSLVDKYEAAHDLWAYLKLKYSRTDAVTANMYMPKIQTFTFDDNHWSVG